jgi:hypothetical protein
MLEHSSFLATGFKSYQFVVEYLKQVLGMSASISVSVISNVNIINAGAIQLVLFRDQLCKLPKLKRTGNAALWRIFS